MLYARPVREPQVAGEARRLLYRSQSKRRLTRANGDSESKAGDFLPSERDECPSLRGPGAWGNGRAYADLEEAEQSTLLALSCGKLITKQIALSPERAEVALRHPVRRGNLGRSGYASRSGLAAAHTDLAKMLAFAGCRAP